MLSSIYVHANTVDQQESLKKYIMGACQKSTSTCTIKDAFLNRRFTGGTWAALGVMFWHEVVGYNAIMLYSNQMLDDMSRNGAALTPR